VLAPRGLAASKAAGSTETLIHMIRIAHVSDLHVLSRTAARMASHHLQQAADGSIKRAIEGS
jgi:hypothetical protein